MEHFPLRSNVSIQIESILVDEKIIDQEPFSTRFEMFVKFWFRYSILFVTDKQSFSVLLCI